MRKTFELRDYHEFEEEEQLFSVEPPEVLPIPAFSFDDALRRYVQHLPVEHDLQVVYPWRDRAWQGDWLWRRGGISAAEAHFWFVAMTHPHRHTDTQLEARLPDALARWNDPQWRAFSPAEAEQLLRHWFDEERREREEVRWFAYAYFSRLLMELCAVADVLHILMSVIPGEEVRHFFVHLHTDTMPASQADELENQVRAIVEQVDLTRSEQDAYVAVRLLEALPCEPAALALCERVHVLTQRSSTLTRDCVNLLREPQNFATWFNAFEDYHIAQEMIPSLIMRGGFEIVEALMRRVVTQDTAFIAVAFKDLLRVHSWRSVEGFLTLSHHKMFSAAARDWLVSNGDHSAHGLLNVWLDTSHADSRQAKRFLEEMCARGHVEVITRHKDDEPSAPRRKRIEDELLAYYTS